MTSRRRVMTSTAIAWVAIVVMLESFRIWRVLNGPRDSEEYVYHLDFQLFASAFLVLTRWLPLLAALLAVELGLFYFLSKIQRRSDASLMR
jgi:hypothetical protein